MCAVGGQSDLGELENEAFWYSIFERVSFLTCLLLYRLCRYLRGGNEGFETWVERKKGRESLPQASFPVRKGKE